MRTFKVWLAVFFGTPAILGAAVLVSLGIHWLIYHFLRDYAVLIMFFVFLWTILSVAITWSITDAGDGGW
jgi:hypothetical protein